MRPAAIILFPFAVLYDLMTSVRNKMFDLELKPSASFDVPVISVGNLNVGGTGKTPMIEHLARTLIPNFKIATLSRGYMRKTRGFRIAGPTDNASTLGDEPYQLYNKFNGKLNVTVGEERAMAIPQIIHEIPEVNVVLLDDAFQHRQVKPSFQVLLTDYSKPFYNDLLLPAGRLRESKKGAVRADVVVVTKCPHDLSDDRMIEVQQKIKTYTSKPVFFAGIRYGEAEAFVNGHSVAFKEKVVLVSGLADANRFEEYCSKQFGVVKHFDFNDHHNYQEGELKEVNEVARKHGAVVITTEKDAVKINTERFKLITSEISWFYLPIEMEFLKNGKDFDEMILNAARNA